MTKAELDKKSDAEIDRLLEKARAVVRAATAANPHVIFHSEGWALPVSVIGRERAYRVILAALDSK